MRGCWMNSQRDVTQVHFFHFPKYSHSSLFLSLSSRLPVINFIISPSNPIIIYFLQFFRSFSQIDFWMIKLHNFHLMFCSFRFEYLKFQTFFQLAKKFYFKVNLMFSFFIVICSFWFLWKFKLIRFRSMRWQK